MTALATRPPVTFDHPADSDDLLRIRRGEVRFVDVPERNYLAVDGEGDPNEDPSFREAFEALYPVAYTVHFGLKRRGISRRVGALEGLWWLEPDQPWTVERLTGPKTGWHWTLLLAVPDEATDEEVTAAIEEVGRRKAPAGLSRLQVDRWREGPSAQILHVGPYDAEVPTIERLHATIGAAGLRPRGRHHEIYLGDPRRSAPERLRTIIRQPVE